ncbi:hypothetical protein ACGC1H_007074 [Rhizoctonia solani]
MPGFRKIFWNFGIERSRNSIAIAYYQPRDCCQPRPWPLASPVTFLLGPFIRIPRGIMSYCHTCETQCADITRHLFSYHTQPGVTNPSMAASVSNEFELGDAEDEQTFCFQCSREFRTAAALTAHLGDAQVHFRRAENRAHVLLGTPGYPTHNATGSHRLHPRSSRPHENLGHDYEGSDARSDSSPPRALGRERSRSRGPPRNELDREYAPQDGQGSLYDASSTYQSSEDSSEELTSESDENDDILMDTEYETQTHLGAIPVSPISRHAQYPQTSGLVVGDTQSLNPPYTPGAYTFIHPQGVNAYAQEGTSMSHSRPESELATGTSNYHHRSETTQRLAVLQTGDSFNSSHAPQTHNVATPRGHGIMCPICLDPAENVTSTLCGHIFCASCIKLALSMREACPVCNRPTGRWSTHPIYPAF